MKKIINDPQNVVSESLIGLEYANENLVYIEELEVIAKRNKTGNVGVVSGGGSGHEPAHAGYVGEGMLDAAVAGNVFSSPSPDRIIEGIRRADSGKGVLLVVKNYSGDIMNFNLAKELAEMEGIKVEMVIVRDDVAVEDSTFTAGRRGIAGTIFVHKVAGAAAMKGLDLGEVKRISQKASDNIRSMGMSFTGCTIPENGKPNFELKDDEMEIGMGIHGEPGIEKSKIKTAYEIANILIGHILEDKEYQGKEVALLTNGLGTTPLMELLILNKNVREILDNKNVKVYKNLVGNYMTALDMAGCSLSLLELDDELKEMIEAKCDTPALTIK